MERQRVADAAKGVGKPKVGGKFELVDQEGKRFTDEDMKGGYSLVSGLCRGLGAGVEENLLGRTMAERHDLRDKTC